MAQPLPESTVAAGPFSAWLRRMRRSLLGKEGMDVPCGDCVGCCVSGYSLQLRPEDQRAAARIPATFIVNAPGFAQGHLTVRPLSSGLCPMLEGGRCSIYADRPQTCLDYDCRIFAAAGMDAGGEDKAVINQRVREWRFSYPEPMDRREHEAVRAAAAFIRDRRDSFSVRVPAGPMGIAVFAIKSYEVFLDPAVVNKNGAEVARAVLEAVRNFDTSA
ncbi:YkgJ family cysteine cluster protein [Steroidobacter sp. S1-65]|uniref:YkgJ family cysteine cluster protein n=1 Tax=Steroidobacter gossypii TaxID=2805490 RepID=A0ABS1WWK1_9GAMM|nr:YkgJ family cysteine cluster protein [Steroidobacter gossypii]MBM0105352.1 YkgJ family cysteine cluster protein [Steroidobacter gossypii]